MNFLDKRFKVIIIDNPISLMDDPFCNHLLNKTLKIKQKSYALTYGNNVLPMDKSDFFSTHLIFCEELNNEFIPIFTYKSCTYNRCLFYGVEFPGLTLMKNDGHPSCVDKITDLLKQAEHPSSISFDSSWAQNVDYRFTKNSEFKQFLMEVTMMLGVLHHHEFNIPQMMTCGAVIVKTDLFFLKMGLKYLNKEAKFIQKNLNNEEAYIFYTNEFSEYALKMANKHEHIWQEKILMSGSMPEVQLKKIA